MIIAYRAWLLGLRSGMLYSASAPNRQARTERACWEAATVTAVCNTGGRGGSALTGCTHIAGRRLGSKCGIYAYAAARDVAELVDLLSVTSSTLETYLRDAKRDEKQQQQDRVWDLWLDCASPAEIERQVGITDQTATNWISKKRTDPGFREALASQQHFDIWQFQTSDGESSYFGKMPPQVVENLLWLYTDPGQVVFETAVRLIDAKTGERWIKTGNHDVEKAALDAAELWEQTFGVPVYFVFTDWSVATVEMLRSIELRDGPRYGNGSGTPYWLFAATVCVPFDALFSAPVKREA